MRHQLASRVAQGAFWSGVERWSARLVSMVVLVVLARNVTPEAFGIVAIASVVLTLVGVVLEQGITQAIIQRSELEDDHLDAAFWFSLALAAALGGAMLAIAGVVAGAFSNPDVEAVLRWFAIVPLSGAVGTVPSAILQRELRFKAMSVRGLVANVVGGAIGVCLAFSGFDIGALIGLTVTTSIVSSAVLFRAAAWRPSLRLSPRHLGDLLRFGTTVFFTDLVGFVNRRSDDVIVGHQLGPGSLGVYGMGYRLFMTVTDLVLVPINDVALPAFSKLQNDRAELAASFLRIIRVSSLLAFPAFVGLSMLAPDLTDVLFGEAWAPSAPVMRIVALVGVIHAVTFYQHTALIAMGKVGTSLAITAAYALVNVAGFLIAVRYGVVAVAAAYALRAAAIAPIESRIAARHLGLSARDYGRALMPAAGATAALACVVAIGQALLSSPVPTLAVCVPLGALAYGLVARTLARETIDEVWAEIRGRSPRREIATSSE